MSDRQICALLAAIGLSVALRAQQAGSLRGVVIDQDFEVPLAGAVVQILETGQRLETADQGNFVFPQLRPGRYTVIAAKDGYVRQVRADIVIAAGQLTEISIPLAGDFTDLEEFVVQESLQSGTGTEAALLDLRFDSPALVDSISADLMSKAGAGDAASALRLVSGASLANGKSAVIRGLPDRYVSSLMNGVLLPSADEDKRAVELDQFPADVIESLQVSKTFTPDQLGNSSGGAVNVVLKGVPDEPLFFKYKVGTKYNTNFTGRSDFLTYDGGGVHAFGKSGSERRVQENGQNWTGAVGTETGPAPINYDFSGSFGGRVDIGKGWRAGAFVNLFYERDNTFFENGRDESRWILLPGDRMSPQYNQGAPQLGEFNTALFDVTQSTQSAQWGGLTTMGVANQDHAITFAYLSTRQATDTATLTEDTQGKEYYFPGHDPDNPASPGHDDLLAAPWIRQHTLAYEERKTDTMQLSGRHRIQLYGFGSMTGAELDWTLARSNAIRDEPDRRQFGERWLPTGTFITLKPAAQFTLGNLQRIFEKIEEDSQNATFNLKLPFEVWSGRKGYIKTGVFSDRVDRTFDQNTYSNFNDNSFFVGQWDQIDWTQVWQFENHPISATPANSVDPKDGTDVDYKGKQRIGATYLMLELPLLDNLRLIGGVRVESTKISIVNDPENQALWVPPGQFGVEAIVLSDPSVYNAEVAQTDTLPAAALVYEPISGVTLRGAYSETIARQTFKELTPVFQQEFLGGPIFVGNPDLRISQVRNWDLRVDFTPASGTLLSASWFQKDIRDPIEYIEQLALYTFTTAVNLPRGTVTGIEVEMRQNLGELWEPLQGWGVGGNSTWIDGTVRLRDQDILEFESLYGVRPKSTREITNTPDYLWNLYTTYDIAATRSSIGVFYTVTGDTLVQGPGPTRTFFVPATFDVRYDSLNITFVQRLGSNVAVTLAARNATNAERRQVYRSEFLDEDVTRRSFRAGIQYSVAIGGEIRF